MLSPVKLPYELKSIYVAHRRRQPRTAPAPTSHSC